MLYLTLRQMEYVVAVARAGSLSAAAVSLNVSQPSLSVALTQVEDHLGESLFLRRKGSPIIPTAFGERYVAEAAELLAMARRLSDPALAGENAAIIALWAAIFGLLTADLTARAGTLGPAIAMHMFNNVMAILLVSVPDTLSGLSLAVLPASMSDPGALQSWLMLDFAMMIVSWLAARLALRV